MYKTITIPLSDSEFRRLRERASRNFRRPRDEACYLLLSGLGLATPTNKEGDAPAIEATCATFVETPYPPCLAN